MTRRRSDSLALCRALLCVAVLSVGCSRRSAAIAPAGGTDAQRALERRVQEQLRVANDRTLFTLFAFLNVAGYDDEHNAAGMHPVRVQVRDRLARAVPQSFVLHARRYYAAHARQADPWSYSVVAMATSGPPAFEPGRQWTAELAHTAPFDSLAGLSALLREFQALAPVESLFTAVEPQQERYARRPRCCRNTAAASSWSGSSMNSSPHTRRALDRSQTSTLGSSNDSIVIWS